MRVVAVVAVMLVLLLLWLLLMMMLLGVIIERMGEVPPQGTFPERGCEPVRVAIHPVFKL
jgi:hypothetical protein